jgi:hypothetical protein
MSREIERLKRDARRLTIELAEGYNRGDCGIHLMEHITPALVIKRAARDAILDKLRRIDPAFPR